MAAPTQASPHLVLDGLPFATDRLAAGDGQLRRLRMRQEAFARRVFARLACDADVVLDVGAHIGTYTVAAATGSPSARLVACEPDPVNFGNLVRTLELNDLSARATPLNVCLAAAEGRRTLFTGRSSGLHSLFPSPLGTGATEGVAATTADAVLEAVLQPGDRVLVKIDVEGAELDVLAGFELLAELADVDVLIEYFPDLGRAIGRDLRTLFPAMRRLGFRGLVVDERRRRLLPAAATDEVLGRSAAEEAARGKAAADIHPVVNLIFRKHSASPSLSGSLDSLM